MTQLHDLEATTEQLDEWFAGHEKRAEALQIKIHQENRSHTKLADAAARAAVAKAIVLAAFEKCDRLNVGVKWRSGARVYQLDPKKLLFIHPDAH